MSLVHLHIPSPPVGGRRRRYAPGFTLLETLLALSLMIILLSGVYGFYATTLQARDAGSRVARDAMLAHSMLDRIADEIRHSTDLLPGDGVGFSGDHNRITIVRASMPENYAFEKHDSKRERLPPGQMDIRRITYELVWDEELTDDEGVKLCHGLLRSEQRTFDPNPKFVMKQAEGEAPPVEGEEEMAPGPRMMPVERELIAPEIKYVRFEFFDGAEWRDRWQAIQGDMDAATGTRDHALPQAVRVTIGNERVAPEDEEFEINQLKDMEDRHKKQLYHADRFTLVVYLLQSDQSLLSSRKYGMKNNPDLQTGGDQ